MAGLGDLVVSMHADTASFQSDLGRAAHISEREFGKIIRNASIAGNIIGEALGDIGRAAFRMAGEFLSAAADLDDMAEKTGASVAELSKLAQQAHISGTSLSTIETGLVRLSRSLNENDEEAKRATKALHALGLSADALRNKDTAQAMQIVAVALNKYADGSGKTALALDLLGRNGAQLLPVLKDMANDGELNARVTAKQAAEAEELGKAWRRLTNEAKGAAQSLALDLVPWLLTTISNMKEATTIAGGLASGLMLLARTNGLKDFGLDLKNTQEQLAGLREEKDRVLKNSRGPVDTSGLDLAIADAEKRIKLLQYQQRQAALAAGGSDTPGEMQRFGLGGQKQALNYVSPAAAGKPGRTPKAIADNSIKEAERAAREQLEIQRRLGEADLRAQQYFAGEIRKLAEEEAKDRENQIAQTRRLQQADLDAMKDYASQIDKINKGTKDVSDSSREMGHAISTAFESAILQGRKATDVAKSFIQTLGQIALRNLITKPLEEGIGGFLKDGLGSLFSGGELPSFAVGTNYVPETGLAMVHKGEAIIPAGQNHGGTTVVQHIHVDSRSDIASVNHAMAVSRQQAASVVEDRSRRRVR